MGALYRLGLLPRQLFQHLQALCQGHAAGRGRRCADQFAAVGQLHLQRAAFDHPVVAQVGGAPDAAAGADPGEQLVRCLAFVEADPPVAPEAFQGTCQLRLAEQVPFVGDSALVEEDPRGFRVLAHRFQAHGDAVAVDPVDGYAIHRQADRRHQVVGQGLASVAAAQFDQRRRQAGDRRRQRAVDGQPGVDLAVASVHVGVGGLRCALAGVEEAIGRRRAGLAQKEESTAAESRAVRLGYRQGSGDGRRGVEGVAAIGQGFQAGDSRGRMRRGDGGLLRCVGVAAKAVGMRREAEQGQAAGGDQGTDGQVQEGHGGSLFSGVRGTGPRTPQTGLPRIAKSASDGARTVPEGQAPAGIRPCR